MIPYYEYYLVAVAIAFCVLLVYSICRLLCHCSIYGSQKGIISLLTATYIITLCDNTLIILMIVFYRIDLYSALHQHNEIPNMIYICGLYGILWLNFVLAFLIMCSWFILFSALFNVALSTSKKLICTAFISVILYLIILSVVYILFEMTNTLTFALYIPISAYIDLLPILINIMIGLFCLCKLPISEPIDLTIGLYQRNTLCSCYTTITKYIWMMIMIPIFQSIVVVLIVLEINLWDNDLTILIYFLSQFIALVLSWNFVGVSIQSSAKQNIVLKVLSGKISYTVELKQSVQSQSYIQPPVETEHIEAIRESVNSKSVSNVYIDELKDDFQICTVSDIDPESNFKIIEPLGEGAYGPVFAAIDSRNQQMVALKVMSFNPNECDDLLSEIKILQQCHSPYIVNFVDTFMKEENLWLAMEYCDGGSILDVMKITKQHLTELQSQCVLYQALSGLTYLHSMHLIHRDIKAANILVNSAGCCKLADFGVAKVLSASGVGTTIGSPYWMAPEVIGSDSYDNSADIWSLGIVAIEISMGKPPLSDYKPMQAMLMIPKSPPPDIKQYNLSEPFLQFISMCLKKEPEQRSTAKELMRDPWIQKVESNNKQELIPLMDTAIPLLTKQRKLSAFIANQEESEDDDIDIDNDETDERQIQHQPTGTCIMVMPTVSDDAVDIYGHDDETEQKEETVEDTEVRHYTDSSSDESDSPQSKIIMEF